MIAQLRGKILPGDDKNLIVDVNGVGYDITCSENTKQDLDLGEFGKIFIYTHVREDAFILFGFSTMAEKKLFLSLIKVNGIGPKLACNALSATPVENIVNFIENGDVKGLTSLPKIGKKTAEQIVLSLKGKLVLESDAVIFSKFTSRDEICSALINLGFKANDVTQVVDNMAKEIDVQSGIRQGLTALTSANL